MQIRTIKALAELFSDIIADTDAGHGPKNTGTLARNIAESVIETIYEQENLTLENLDLFHDIVDGKITEEDLL